MQGNTKAHARPRLLGVFAHPDDETFCAGGTLAKYAAAGWETMVVSATRGQAGQIRDARVATRRSLGQVREQELHKACAQLGVRHVQCLDYMDGTLEQVDRQELTGAIVEIMRRFQPDVVISFGADGAYGHPDHIAISEATSEAFRSAGDPVCFSEQLDSGLALHSPQSLYYSHFPYNPTLLLDWLAHWVAERDTRFKGGTDFMQALALFAQAATTLRYTRDHVEVSWFPPGFFIVEQDEPGASLYLILSGSAEVVQEDDAGAVRTVARIGPGEFFGEMALVKAQPRMAHVIAVESVTCLVFSPSEPLLFASRGANARFTTASATEDSGGGATTCIDVTAFVEHKSAAIAAHRTQYPIAPEMFPLSLLRELLGREYFVRVYSPLVYETELSRGTADTFAEGFVEVQY